VETARRWVDAGTERLHLVDLDGAVAGEPRNRAAIEAIAKEFPHIKIQVGGGIRTEATIESYLDIGVQYLIIGTQAVRDPHFIEEMAPAYPGHLIVGLDAKDGKVATDGWSKLSRHDVIDMAQRFESFGIESIIYTDISRDGMMQGVNVESTATLANAVKTDVIASGGVTDIDDIKRLLAVDADIAGCILGRALYEGTLDLAEAIALTKA
jgi:phosphoribosylformimino-5-aminoimidazole carboxamide ribotide isomerase